MDAIYYEDNMVAIPFKVVHGEVPRYVICVAVSLESEEFALHVLRFVLGVGHIGVLLLLLRPLAVLLLLHLKVLVCDRLSASEKNLALFLVHESDAWLPTYSRDVLFIVKFDLRLQLFTIHSTPIKQVKVLAFFGLARSFLRSLHECKFPGLRGQFFFWCLLVAVICTKP